MMLFFNSYTCRKKSGGFVKQRNKIFAEVPEFSIQVLAIREKMEASAGRGCKRNISSAKLSLASLPCNLWPFSESSVLPCQMVLLTKASCKF